MADEGSALCSFGVFSAESLRRGAQLGFCGDFESPASRRSSRALGLKEVQLLFFLLPRVPILHVGSFIAQVLPSV